MRHRQPAFILPHKIQERLCWRASPSSLGKTTAHPSDRTIRYIVRDGRNPLRHRGLLLLNCFQQHLCCEALAKAPLYWERAGAQSTLHLLRTPDLFLISRKQFKNHCIMLQLRTRVVLAQGHTA